MGSTAIIVELKSNVISTEMIFAIKAKIIDEKPLGSTKPLKINKKTRIKSL